MENEKLDEREAQTLSTVESCLRGWLEQVEGKISELNDELASLKRKIDSIYDEEALQKVRYNLHSVCIHEGNAISGHFWTYIWKPALGKWFKFNDNEVCETTWDDLYLNAVGGSSSSSQQQQQQSNSSTSACTTPASSSGGQNNLSKTSTTNDLSNRPPVNPQQMGHTTLSLIEETNSSATASSGTSSGPVVGQTKTNDKIPSAYFLIYVKAGDESLYQGNWLYIDNLNINLC